MNAQTKLEVLFIDANVADKQTLLANIDKNITVMEINNQSDGLTQIANALDGLKNLDAIHIISHGKTGELQFANGVLNTSNLADYCLQLQKIGAALSVNGDILLYGCDVANGEEGETFIHSFMAAMWQAAKAKRLSIHWQELPKLMLSCLTASLHTPMLSNFNNKIVAFCNS